MGFLRCVLVAAVGVGAMGQVGTRPVGTGAATGPAAKLFDPPAGLVESFEAGTLHVDRYGKEGSAVVLLPGLGCGAWEWYGVIGELEGKHRVYVVTLPGFDGRAMTEKRPLFGVFVGDFWGMLEKQKIEKPVVIGHSLGGTLAIALGEDHAERLGGIVAVDGLPVYPQAAMMTAEQRAKAAGDFAKSYAGLDKAGELAAEKQYMETVGTNRAELVDGAAALLARSDAGAMGAWMEADLTTDLRAGLGKVTVPLVEVMPYEARAGAGGGTGYTKEQTATFYKMLLSGAPRVEVVAVEGSRHFVMLDQAEALGKILERVVEGAGEGR